MYNHGGQQQISIMSLLNQGLIVGVSDQYCVSTGTATVQAGTSGYMYVKPSHTVTIPPVLHYDAGPDIIVCLHTVTVLPVLYYDAGPDISL